MKNGGVGWWLPLHLHFLIFICTIANLYLLFSCFSSRFFQLFFFLIAFFLHHNAFAQKCSLCTPLFCIQGKPLFARLYHNNLSHPFVFPFRLLTPPYLTFLSSG